MDKEWIFFGHHTERFKAGLQAFLDYALEHASFDGSTIKCPCKNCHNGYNRLPYIVGQHLDMYGMDTKYANNPWTEHGEQLPDVVDQDQLGINQTVPPSHQPNNTGMADMLHDVFGIYEGEDDHSEPTVSTHEGPSLPNDQSESTVPTHEGPSLPNNLTPDAQKFYQILQTADKELYPGAGKKMLEFLIKLYQIKVLNGWSDVSFTQLLELLKDYLPPSETLPPSFYLTKKLIKSLSLTYQKIDACPNDCMLYRGNYVLAKECIVCGASRYKENTSPNKKQEPAKVLRYLPIGPRLQRLFMSRHTTEFMVWHSEKRARDGVLRHPADSVAWEELDKLGNCNDFGFDGRNVRLGLASDGFNPFGHMSLSHSTWPVIVVIYNLPPWLCMKKPYMMLSLLIPGPKSPGNDIDVYLQPLIEELNMLWTEGIPTYDAYKKEIFQMRAGLLWTINDFPAYAMLSGYSTKGSKACPTCGPNTDSVWLHHGKKEAFMGYRMWLEEDHIFRSWYNNFNGSTEYRRPPKPLTGSDCLKALENLTFSFGKGKENNSNRKRKRVQNNDNTKYTGPWRKKSVFYQLPYWEHLLLRHNIDVMHVEKNVTENVIGTLLGIDGKNKDSFNARLDMVRMKVKHSLHPKIIEGRKWLPPGEFTLSKEEKTLLCRLLASFRPSDGFSSNIRRCVKIDERKLVNLKSHDYHIIMQFLLPLAIRCTLKSNITKVLLELSAFFRQLCTKVGTIDHFRNLSKRVAITLCKLEMIMPPAFFVVMVHLIIHLADEAAVAGPVQFRWMYPIERYLHDLKKLVRNKSRPEASIVEGYIIEECLSFCTMYLSEGVESKRTRIGRNADDPGIVHREGLPLFVETGRSIEPGQEVTLTDLEWERARKHVLMNCPEIKQYLNDHVANTRRSKNRHTTMMEAQIQAHNTFARYFEELIEKKVQQKEVVDPDIRALAIGPIKKAQRFQKYIMNGFRFFVKAIDGQSTTQNCGVFVKAEVTSYATAGDRRPRDGVKDYYGVLTDIIQLDYRDGRKVLLFDCDWADNRGRNRAVKMDEYGFILVNFDHLLPKQDTLILASQALQFMYVQDPVQTSWHTVIRTRPRDFFDMGIDLESEPYDVQNLAGGANNDEIARTDVDGEYVDDDIS